MLYWAVFPQPTLRWRCRTIIICTPSWNQICVLSLKWSLPRYNVISALMAFIYGERNLYRKFAFAGNANLAKYSQSAVTAGFVKWPDSGSTGVGSEIWYSPILDIGWKVVNVFLSHRIPSATAYENEQSSAMISPSELLDAEAGVMRNFCSKKEKSVLQGKFIGILLIAYI